MDSNRPFGGRRPQPVERRRAKRDKLGIAVSLHSTTQSRVVYLEDVSPTGARISGQNLPVAGRDVLLTIAGIELFGSIIRAGDGQAAIAFDRPIGDMELKTLKIVLEDQTREAMLHAR